MSQMIINIYCKKKCETRCRCCKHRRKGCTIKREDRHIRRCKKRTACKVICRVKRKKARCLKRKLKISIRPIVKRYFYIAPQDINLLEGIVILAHQFVDDRGESITKFSNFGKEGYYNLQVNGVLQEGKMYHITTNAIKFIATEQIIVTGTPIILELVGFTAKLYKK